jgi:hypothetical protein
VISWVSKKHPIVTISSPIAGYVSMTTIYCEVVWLRRILGDLQQGR